MPSKNYLRVLPALMSVLLLGALASACSGPGEATDTTAAAASSTPQHEAPSRQVNCAAPATPKTGVIPLPPGQTELANGKSNLVVHPPARCGLKFREYLDLSDLGSLEGAGRCKDVPETPATPDGRPCSYPLFPKPIFSGAYDSKQWAPVEGEAVDVACQVVGEMIYNKNGKSGGPDSRSNVWDAVTRDDLPKGIGYISDLWLGNQGWRDLQC